MKIGIFLPIHYEGGSFRLAKLYAKLLNNYAKKSNINLQIVFGNTEGKYDLATDLDDLIELGIEIRYLEMKRISNEHGLEYIDFLNLKSENFKPYKGDYIVPYDRGNGFLDCDFWLFMVDRIFNTVLPFRPFGIFATDFIQRYVPEIFDTHIYTSGEPLTTIYRNFRNANLAFSCSPGTAKDLLTYVGRKKEIILLDPLFDDSFIKNKITSNRTPNGDYFIWVTNGTIHKNHLRALKALELYYSKYDGKLQCKITGVQTHFFEPTISRNVYPHIHPYHQIINDIISKSKDLRSNIKILGNISDSDYQETVYGAKFLWHNVIADNGTFSVIEAARMGVRSLSSRYPQQEHINNMFSLNMKFFDPFDVEDAAKALYLMEEDNTPYMPPNEQLTKYSLYGASDLIGKKIYDSIENVLKMSGNEEFIP